jgi:predicted alpha/beta hydrolase family esterase
LAQELLPFAPAPKICLPFPSLLVASQNDPYIEFGRARRLASFWGSAFIDAGAAGHINAESGLGKWSYGRTLLDRLVAHVKGRQTHQPLFEAQIAHYLAESIYDTTL